MKLICDSPAHKSVPDKYVLPPEKRPCDHELLDDLSVALPVIDLHGAVGEGRRQVVGEIMEAGKEFGFIQVVNHGVGEDVIQGFREAATEFFRMPEEAKLKYYSIDHNKPFRIFSGSLTSHNDGNDIRYWRDCLKLRCYPVERLMHQWPSQPEMFREHLAKYAVAVQELARRFLRLIAEGLGFDNHDFFEGDLSGGETLMNVNYYPRCPDPSLTMGIRPHSDRHLLTILSQGEVSGLQAKHRGRWIRVQPIHNAFVINFGLQMEIVTNGLLPSVEHRAVTNSAKARMSVASLITPKMDCRVGPAPAMLDEETNPPKFKDFVCSEFAEAYEAAAGNREAVLDFKIHHTQNPACVNQQFNMH
ncbi:2'-deoxymugineic-acid 2'-dioxygenase-like [Lolium rigidum]|uniref:2'-deoxymugineic-acid 2'-dioxygenase-like n=1 Tax=Lolium rigidum TaxID=89674 RepID=UPI001F5C7B61|nr:2'-deoxymugineic-acid 2'-dioxygenase-like [Lolium rigidum]